MIKILLIEDRIHRQKNIFGKNLVELNKFSILKNISGGNDFVDIQKKLINKEYSALEEYSTIMLHRSAFETNTRNGLIDFLKKTTNLDSLDKIIDKNNSYIDFKKKIQNNITQDKISIIAEIKKASPSAGVIIDNYNPVEIAKIYNDNKVTCLSVLTEEDFFLGNLIHISKIKEQFDLPILCKDFFIDKFQIPLAKSYGADAILIILAGVSDDLANELYEEALKFKMSVIVEVHTVEEAKKALNFKDALIGINNRNLKTLKTDINTTYDIYNALSNHQEPLISESGIKTKDELLDLNNKTSIKTFLIGESLLKNLSENSIFSVL